MRVGIVNDLPLACEALRRVLVTVPSLEVAWLAYDGEQAVAACRRDPPDVVLMDLFMPHMDGVEATRRIMSEKPCAILVVTATVSGHISRVYEAMGCGALDAVDTPVLGLKGDVQGAAMLLHKIHTIGKLIGKPVKVPDPRPAPPRSRMTAPLLVIGASTGGPMALRQILGGLVGMNELAVVLVQHVDVAFAPGLGIWLSEASALPVELIQPGQPLAPGKALLAGTSDHLILDADLTLHYTPAPREAFFRPSVDVFFQSVAAHVATPGIALLLTGMGRDGAAGLLELRRKGWHTIAQDQASSVIWGMPGAAVELGAAEQVLPLTQMAGAIRQWLATRTGDATPKRA